MSQIPKEWDDLSKLLKPIHTKGDYDKVIRVLDMLVGRTDLTKDQKDFVESRLSKNHIRILSERFSVSPNLFL